MNDLVGFENELFEKLKNSGLIERFSVFELEQTPDLAKICEIFERPFEIEFDSYGIYYLDDDGIKQYCPDMKTTISEKGFWLSDKLPNINFDINQNGNVRRAEEAEALYCTIVVANTLKEEIFKEEVKTLSKSYDFKNLKSIDDDTKSFKFILEEWLNLQSEIINIIVSACRYKISDYKKDAAKYLRDGILDSEAIELRVLESKIRSLNFEYSEGVLSPSEIRP